MKMSKTKQFPALFATNTVDGPRDAAHLVALLHACGMSAAAWLVESLREQIDDGEQSLEDRESELQTEHEDAERDLRAELEPYKEAFEEIGREWRKVNGEDSRYEMEPTDDGARTAILEDIRLAAEIRAERETAEKKRAEVRKASAERRALKSVPAKPH